MSRIAIDYQDQHLPMPLSETVEGGEIVFRGFLTCKTSEETQTGMCHINLENLIDQCNTFWHHKGFIKEGCSDFS